MLCIIVIAKNLSLVARSLSKTSPIPISGYQGIVLYNKIHMDYGTGVVYLVAYMKVAVLVKCACQEALKLNNGQMCHFIDGSRLNKVLIK